MPKTSPTKKTAIVRRAKKQHAIVRREPPSIAEAIEKVLIGGDLTPLSVEQRLDYYKKVCMSLGLNPLTRPFDYIAFKVNENDAPKMTLYARRDCTDQLRKIHGISVTKVTRTVEDGMIVAEAEVRDRNGKTDSSIGVIPLTRWNKWKKPQPGLEELTGLELANARMKAETKAKRRATLSICGLGFLDMSELDTIENYSEVTPGGRIVHELNAKPGPQKEVTAEDLEKYESITITPWKEGRVALSGNGVAILRPELSPEAIEEMDIKHNIKEKVIHMKASQVFMLIDRAEKLNIKATLIEPVNPAPDQTQPEQGNLL